MPSTTIGYRWCPSLNKWLSPRGTVLPEELQRDARFLFGSPDLPEPKRVKAEWSWPKRKEAVHVAPALV